MLMNSSSTSDAVAPGARPERRADRRGRVVGFSDGNGVIPSLVMATLLCGREEGTATW